MPTLSPGSLFMPGGSGARVAQIGAFYVTYSVLDEDEHRFGVRVVTSAYAAFVAGWAVFIVGSLSEAANLLRYIVDGRLAADVYRELYG